MRHTDTERQCILNALLDQIKYHDEGQYIRIRSFSEDSFEESHSYLNWLFGVLYQKNWDADYSIQQRTDHLRESLAEVNRRVICLEGHSDLGGENRKDRTFDENKIDLFLSRFRGEILQEVGKQAKERLHIAVFTPLGPLKNGIADYMTVILLSLKRYAEIDIYIDDGYEPDDADILQSFTIYHHKVFHERHDQYDLVLYEFGNNPHHAYIVPYALQYPGVLELHDFNLAYLYQYLPPEYQEIARARSVCVKYPEGCEDNPMNMYLLKVSKGVLAHSEFVRQSVHDEDMSIDVRKIELFSNTILEEKDASDIVKECGLEDCFVFSCFGFATHTKRIREIILSFSNIVQKYPKEKFKLLIVGKFDEDYRILVNGLIRKYHLKKHIVTTGYVTLDDMYKYISCTDVCLNLRYPYGGESSGTLARIMGMGKACIVSRVGAFDEIPDFCCHKIAYGDSQDKELMNITEAMSLLFENGTYRKWIAGNAQTYVMEHLSLEHTVQLYRKSLDHFYCKPIYRTEGLLEKAASFLMCNYFDDPYYAAEYAASRLHPLLYGGGSTKKATAQEVSEESFEITYPALNNELEKREAKKTVKKDVLHLLEEIDSDPRIGMIFAYRYLLNRDPESLMTVEQNRSGWKELREQFLASEEYRRLQGEITEEVVSEDAMQKEIEAFHLESYETEFLKKLRRDGALEDRRKILEIGCGSGKLVRAIAHFCPEANVIGIDPYLKEWWKTGEASEANWQVKLGDGQNIEYPPETFDLIVSVAAFEHIPSPEKCLEEIKRVLKPGGLFITTFSPIWSSIVGHHCEHWVEDTVKMIPPWGHLYLSYDEMFRYLKDSVGVDPKQAEHMCNEIYLDPIINRVDVKQFEKMFQNCGMKVVEKFQHILGNRLGWLTGETRNELTLDIMQKINNRYSIEELLVYGYTLTMQK